MSLDREDLQRRLLDLIAPGSRASVADLDSVDWKALLAMVDEHRIAPLLGWRLEQNAAVTPLPDTVKHHLRNSRRAYSLSSLHAQRELFTVHHALQAAGIPYMALKGAYLAQHVYPQGALRPMRDLDILVPKTRVLEAYQRLLEAGMARSMGSPGNLEAALLTQKHLPPLHGVTDSMAVELHARLTNPDPATVHLPDLSDDPGLWQRRVFKPLGDVMIPYMAPTDLLLHLLVHAVYDHQFSNGPLFLPDIDLLLQTDSIDWTMFWEQAETHGWTRGALLGLRMAEHYAGRSFDLKSLPAGADPGTLDALLPQARLLMLRWSSSRTVASISVNRDLAAMDWTERASWMIRRAFPPREEIAAYHPISAASPLVYFWYPVRWLRILTQRAPDAIRSRIDQQRRKEQALIEILEQWIKA